MAGPSLEDIQEEFADLDLPITDDEVLERLQVWIFVEQSVNLYLYIFLEDALPIIKGSVIWPRLLVNLPGRFFIHTVHFDN
jgi:hypothetical protein